MLHHDTNLDSDPHPLVAQVPLTVSPFLQLPSATTLPYTYKQLPSTLPPSCIDTYAQQQPPSSDSGAQQRQSQSQPQARYITSSTGAHSASPDDIIASCRALQSHLLNLADESRKKVAEWENSIRERELAEKRRVAPGWLDSEAHMLMPEKKGVANENKDLMDADMGDGEQAAAAAAAVSGQNKEGEDLDRAFGGMNLR